MVNQLPAFFFWWHVILDFFLVVMSSCLVCFGSYRLVFCPSVMGGGIDRFFHWGGFPNVLQRDQKFVSSDGGD